MPLDSRIQFIRYARKQSDTFDAFFRKHYIWFDLTLGKPGTLDALVDLAEAATWQYHQDGCIVCGKYFNPWDTAHYRDSPDSHYEEGPLCGLCADRLW
jgi:hypothetical protein